MNVKQLVEDIKKLIAQSELQKIMNPQLTVLPPTTPESEQLTYGPEGNNISWNYLQGNGSFDFFALDKINADILLIYLARSSQMFRKLGAPYVTPGITRRFKEDLLDDKYPVFNVSEDWSL